MKEHPILFSGPMIRAINDDRKTQTRRIMSPQPEGDPAKRWPDPDRWSWPCSKARTMLSLEDTPCACPYGYRGDRLWVRETWGLHAPFDLTDWLRGSIDEDDATENDIEYRADWASDHEPAAWRPSIFMPRWASRIMLGITEVRVQRLQDISEEDARAEGLSWWSKDGTIRKWGLARRHVSGELDFVEPWAEMARSHTEAFERLWDSINAKRAPWESNPWVWAISFSRVT